MTSYRITLVPLAEELKAKGEKVLPPFYADDLSLDGLAKASTRLMLHVMEYGPDQGNFLEPTKLIHICDDKSQVEVARAVFKKLGLEVKFYDGFWCVGRFICRDAQRENYLQTAYSGLTLSLQAEWQYQQRTVPGVGAVMGSIEDALCQEFFPTLFGELDPGEVKAKQMLWGNIIKR
eukprot:13858367-Ditylum_brightwellii.AAC.1